MQTETDGGESQCHQGRKLIKAVVLVACIIAFVAAMSAFASSGITERVSVDSGGNQADGHSFATTPMSDDGRFVAFASIAPNLVPGDTNGAADLFVHDRLAGTAERVSVATDGSQADAGSFNPDISADGRFVAFYSSATNLVQGDTNDAQDTFVHDRETGTTERVSVASDGSQGDRASTHPPAVSADGRFVGFASNATNLVPGDTNGVTDIFVHDRQTGTTERVNVAWDGTQGDEWSTGTAISGDGRYVAFYSHATNLVPSDTNATADIFVHDRQTGMTEWVTANSADHQGSNSPDLTPSITPDGRYVAFWSPASNLVPGDTNGQTDVFVHDRLVNATERVSVATDGSQADAGSFNPDISADGRFVAFNSRSASLVPGDTNGLDDTFVHDRLTGTTERVSIASDGSQAEGAGQVFGFPATSADGRFVAFLSDATNLVPDDTNDSWDVFVHDRAAMPTPTPTLTATSIPSLTPTAAATSTPPATDTATPADSVTETTTSTATATDTPTNTATATLTAMNTSTGTATSTPIGTSTPTNTATNTPTSTPTPAVGMEKVPEGSVAGGNADLTVPKANLFLCSSGPCAGPGEGDLVVVERVSNIATGDSNGDMVQDGLGAYEFNVEYDNFVIQSVNPSDIVFAAGGAGASRGPASCSFSLVLENIVRFGCVTTGPTPNGPIGSFDLAKLDLVPHPDLANDLFPGNDNGVPTVIKDNGCELADVFGHPVLGSVSGGLLPTCGDLAVTVRILEGDLNLDCKVDVTDEQLIGVHYASVFGSAYYSTWFDLEPRQHDLDIDVKDLQKVFGRDGSTCQNPVPAQTPVPPAAPFGN